MITDVLGYLENSAKKNPNKVMMSDCNKSMTYGEVVEYAKRIGTFLANKVKCKNKPIAVIIGRDIESILMFLGIVYSGNFYCPLDPNLPSIRISKMLNTIKPIVVTGKTKECQIIFEEKDVSVYGYFTLEEMINCSVDVETLDSIRRRRIDTDPLYTIFTSGSTGVPKAVLVSHRSVIDLVNAFDNAFEFGDGLIIGNQAPFDFDVSVKDIYITIAHSGALVVIPQEMFAFPAKLISFLNDFSINTIIWAVTALCIVANLKLFRKNKPLYLKYVFFSGEVMPLKSLKYWMEQVPDASYVNLYGPTEITCNCTYYKVPKDYNSNEVLPIGKPFVNTDIIVLNESNELISDNEIGELCVRGSSLALGYYNELSKTAERFCQNPLNCHYPELIYRTGDLVKYDENSNLVYCARVDNQIKHMGHRIELNEIEAAVDSIEMVERCCCIYDSVRENIILVYQSDGLSDMEISDYLLKILPKYMMPTKYIKMERIPLNSHLKIDRTLIKEKVLCKCE